MCIRDSHHRILDFFNNRLLSIHAEITGFGIDIHFYVICFTEMILTGLDQ